MSLAKRIFREKQLVAIPLILLLLVNVAAYLFVVYPLLRRAAGAADRAASAANVRLVAERDQTAARALVAGQARAGEELATFYDKVLPADFVAARRMTYMRLPELAKKAKVKYEAGSFELDQTIKSGRVGRLHTKMVLQGDYEGFRRFVYELETSAEFLIIDGVTLAQGEPGKPLTLNLEVSTYYRVGAHGA